MNYTPLNYEQISLLTAPIHPNTVKSYNNKTFAYWERSLFQRACSVISFEVPEEWNGPVKDFFYYCLFKFGYIAIFNHNKFGLSFQPCSLRGQDFYYQPTNALISNPALNESLDLKIGKNCELLKLTPDYIGIWDVIEYYAEKLSNLDNAINMSIINSKFAYILGARDKAGAEALKKVLDKVNRGEPAVIMDVKLLNNKEDKDTPFQFLERTNIKNGYLTTDMLNDFRTLIADFDKEIGIPSINYEKKERLNEREAMTHIDDGTARSEVWLNTLTTSIENIKKLYPGITLSAALNYKEEGEPVGSEYQNDND